MKQHLAAFALAAALVSAAPFALADIPNPTTSSSGTGGTGGTSGTGASTSGSGGDGSGKNSGGCAASAGTAHGSAALLIGLGLLLAAPLARRRRARA